MVTTLSILSFHLSDLTFIEPHIIPHVMYVHYSQLSYLHQCLYRLQSLQSARRFRLLKILKFEMDVGWVLIAMQLFHVLEDMGAYLKWWKVKPVMSFPLMTVINP